MSPCPSLKVGDLKPSLSERVLFSWSHHKQVPAKSGCYVLTNFTGDVLYVGLASTSIRDRMGVHLETVEKRSVGPSGAAYWFHYLLFDRQKLPQIEQGWINQAILATGARPPLNKIDSPT
jgi:hypothetical protein